MLADFVSQASPMIPAIVVSCVNEIEQRGLTEVRSLSPVSLWSAMVIWKFLSKCHLYNRQACTGSQAVTAQ
jgi:hypothetical protein